MTTKTEVEVEESLDIENLRDRLSEMTDLAMRYKEERDSYKAALADLQPKPKSVPVWLQRSRAAAEGIPKDN